MEIGIGIEIVFEIEIGIEIEMGIEIEIVTNGATNKMRIEI
jgi:hypothetical protein